MESWLAWFLHWMGMEREDGKGRRKEGKGEIRGGGWKQFLSKSVAFVFSISIFFLGIFFGQIN